MVQQLLRHRYLPNTAHAVGIYMPHICRIPNPPDLLLMLCAHTAMCRRCDSNRRPAY